MPSEEACCILYAREGLTQGPARCDPEDVPPEGGHRTLAGASLCPTLRVSSRVLRTGKDRSEDTIRVLSSN